MRHARAGSRRRALERCATESHGEPAHEEPAECRGGASPYAPSPGVRRAHEAGDRNQDRRGSTAKRRQGRKAWRGRSDRRWRTEPTWEDRRTQVGLLGKLVVGLCQDDLRPGFPGLKRASVDERGSPTPTVRDRRRIEPERGEDTVFRRRRARLGEERRGRTQKPKQTAKIAARTAKHSTSPHETNRRIQGRTDPIASRGHQIAYLTPST